MAVNASDKKLIWSDRKHHLWFPISFTEYELTRDRLYEKRGFFNTSYDELLLYRVTDIGLRRNFLQKIFGTGTLVLTSRVDAARETLLVNIKEPVRVKDKLSDLIEDARQRRRVVGKEFFGSDIYIDADGMADMSDSDDGDFLGH